MLDQKLQTCSLDHNLIMQKSSKKLEKSRKKDFINNGKRKKYLILITKL